jgi:DNA-binding MarR family transcriptional regulator
MVNADYCCLDEIQKTVIIEDLSTRGDDLCAAMAFSRLHHTLLQVVTVELRRCGFWDVGAAQALMLNGMGRRRMTVGDIGALHYPGGNASYNVKRLAELGLVERCVGADRRCVEVAVTEDGMRVAAVVEALLTRLEAGLGGPAAIRALARMQEGLVRFMAHEEFAANRSNQREPAGVRRDPAQHRRDQGRVTLDRLERRSLVPAVRTVADLAAMEPNSDE